MNQVAIKRQQGNPDCLNAASLAERELAAFFGAVTELFGSKVAAISAEEWLHELVATDDLPTSPRDWRGITAKASARLANRMQALSLSTALATT